MAFVLFTIAGTIMNALAFRGTIIFFSKLTITVKTNTKDMIWHLRSFRGPETNGMKGCLKRMKQEHTSAMLVKQCLSSSVKWSHLGQIPRFQKIDLGQLFK